MEFNDPSGDWPVTPITKPGKRPKFKETMTNIRTISLTQTTEEICESLPLTASTASKPQDVPIRRNVQPNFEFSRSQFPPTLETPRITSTSILELSESEKENQMSQSMSETCASQRHQSAASSPMRPAKSPRLFRRCHSGGDLCNSRPAFEVEQLAEMLKAVTADSSPFDYCTPLDILSPNEVTQENVSNCDLRYASSNSSMSSGSDEESSASSMKEVNLLGSTKSSRVRVSFRPMRTKAIQSPSTEHKLEHHASREGRLVIIDCRYPYEYYGGHIHGAINMAEWPKLRRFLFGSQGKCCANKLASKIPRSSRTVFVMHCEFSSQRAPKLLNLLRNHDRLIHMSFYPALRYPKIFLLRGGYAAFFRSHPELCEPSAYVKMHSFPELLSSWSRHCEIVNRRSSVCCDCWPGVVRLPLFPLPMQ